MAESAKSTFKKRLHSVVIVIAFVSMYITGLLGNLTNPRFSGVVNAWNALVAFFVTELSLIVFPITFFILCGIAILILHKSWKNGLLDDKMGRAFRHSNTISPYGDAHVMEPHEYTDVAQIRKLDDCKGIVVGQLTENGEECVDFNPKRINTHMFVVAMSGSGKTFGFVKPYVYQSIKRRHSLVITDPKGELFQDTASLLRDNGYHVRRLDFKNLELSDGWDCLKLLRGENMRTKVQIFSNAAISNISPNDNSIFAKGSDSLLQALILRVLLGHDFPEEEKNIKSVYEMLQNPAGYEYLDQMFDKNALTEEELPCLPPYLAYKQGSANLSANIATHLANGLQLFQDEMLCKVLSTDDIDLTLPGKEPCAYFCVFPDDHDTYRFVISLFFTMFFIELVDYADAQPTLKLPVPTDFLLDEFPSIGIIPDWAKKMSTIRSRDISAVMITQDFTQLKQNYRETWPTILNNCGALITLGINEMETAEWVSKRIGETSIEVESTSRTNIGGIKKKDLVTKDSIGVGKRALFTASEIFEIGKDNNLVVIAGRNPIFSNKTPHTIFKESKMLRPIPKDEMIRIDDKHGRKVFRDCENEYVKRFWSTHNIKPVGNPWDLSDALYTEEGQDPVSMVFEIIKEDIRGVLGVFRKANKPAPQPVLQKSDANDNGKPRLSNEMAEKGAFDKFYQQYKEEAETTLTDTGDVGIDIPDFVVDDATGDVSLSDDSDKDSFDIFNDIEEKEEDRIPARPSVKEEPSVVKKDVTPPVKTPETPKADKTTADQAPTKKPQFTRKDMQFDLSQQAPDASKGFASPPAIKRK